MKKLVSTHTRTEKTQKDAFWEQIDTIAQDELGKLTEIGISPNDIQSGPIRDRQFIAPPKSNAKRDKSLVGQVETFLFACPGTKKTEQLTNPFEPLLDSSYNSGSPYKEYMTSINNNKKTKREDQTKFNVKYGETLINYLSEIIKKNKYRNDFFNSIQTDYIRTSSFELLTNDNQAKNIAQPELKSIFEGLLNDIISLNKMDPTDSQAKEKLIHVLSLISDCFHGNTGSKNLASIREELYLNPQLREILTRFDNQSCDAIKQTFEEKGKDKESLLILYVIARMRQSEKGIAIHNIQANQDITTSNQSPDTPDMSQQTMQEIKSEAHHEEPLKTDLDAETLPLPPSQPKIDRRALLTRQSATTVMDTPTYNDNDFKALLPDLAKTFNAHYQKGRFESDQKGSDEDIQRRSENCLEICLSSLLRDEALLKSCYEDKTDKSLDKLLGTQVEEWKTPYHRKLAKSLVAKIVEVRVRSEAQFRLEIADVIQTHFLRDGQIKVNLTANDALKELGKYDERNPFNTNSQIPYMLKLKEYRLGPSYAQLAPSETRTYTYGTLDTNLPTNQYNQQEVDNMVLTGQVLRKMNRTQTAYQVSVVKKVLDEMHLAQSRK